MDFTHDAQLRRIVLTLIIFSTVVIIGTVLLESFCSDEKELIGYISVVGASITFGATGVPMKASGLKETNVDSSVFAVYTSLGVFMVSIPVLIFLWVKNTFIFAPWSILGSLDISIIGFFAFMAVQCLGYAKAPAIWAGTGMIVSYIWGSIYFRENVNNLYYSSFAILLLIVGVYCVSTSQSHISYSETVVKSGHVSISKDVKLDNPDDVLSEPIPVNGSYCDEKDASKSCEAAERTIVPVISRKQSLYSLAFFGSGYIFCFITGALDGSLMVPFKLNKATSLTAALQYLASFGLSSIAVAPILFCIYIFSTGKQISLEQFRVAFFPGTTSGILWAQANFLSVHATYYLGMKTGFPLTQTCIIIAAMWGIFYFKEIQLTPSGYLGRFVFGISAIFVGAYLLAASSA